MGYFETLEKRDALRKSILHRANVVRYDLEKVGKRITEGYYPKYNESYDFEGMLELLDELKFVEEKVKEILDTYTEKPE